MVVEEVSAPGGVAFSPDSRRLAIGHADGSIRLYELPSGRQLKQLEGVPRHGWMVFHPEGRQLAVSCATGIQVYDLETGRILADLPQPHRQAASPGTPTARRWQWPVTTRGFIYGTSPSASKRTSWRDSRNDRHWRSPSTTRAICSPACGWEGVLRLWDPRTGHATVQHASLE